MLFTTTPEKCENARPSQTNTEPRDWFFSSQKNKKQNKEKAQCKKLPKLRNQKSQVPLLKLWLYLIYREALTVLCSVVKHLGSG